MLFWLPYLQCLAFTPPSTRCWFTLSSVLLDTSPSVSETVCVKGAVIKKYRKNMNKLMSSRCSVHDCVPTCLCFFLNSGTFAVISIMIGSVTERLAPDSNFIVNGTNATVNIDARDAYRVQIACSLTVLTGIFQVCFYVHTDRIENF